MQAPCRDCPVGMAAQRRKAVPHEGNEPSIFPVFGKRKLSKMARLAGIEPTTLGFGGQYSIH
jgi:hypothetical protein